MSGVSIEDTPTAIRNQGTLDLSASMINSENASCGSHPIDDASGIENHGTATLQGVSITRTGDTIFNALAATFTATNLTMHDNGPCDEGQSIENSGTMSLTNSTFDADIDHLDDAASIDNEPTGHLAIVHSRFLHNTGGQGTEVISNTGNVTITDSAFDDNTILPLYNDGRVSRTRYALQHEPHAVLRARCHRELRGRPAQSRNLDDRPQHRRHRRWDHKRQRRTCHARRRHDHGQHRAGRNWSGPNQPLPSGGITNDAVMMLRNVTIARNQVIGFRDGRYHAGGVVTMPNGYTALSNSIISDNSAQAPVVAPDCFGAIHSLGYNLVENTTDCTVGATTTGNIIGASAHLYPLAANGGPTMTSLPRWDSPEVDSANPATPDNDNQAKCAELDQRGVARPRDGNADGISRCDMGAVER